MRKDDPGDLVTDAIDAVTLNQDVQWERCARLAAPAERRALDKLRALARVLEGGHAAGPASATLPQTNPNPYAGVLVRRAVLVLIAIATIEVATALMLLPWAWGDYHREHGDVAVFMTTILVGHAASAVLLLFAGRRDQRTWLLGVYCLLQGTLAPLYMLPAVLLDSPPPEMYSVFLRELPASAKLLAYLYVPAFLFSPAFLWAFARECPRVHRRTWLDDFARRMVPASVVIGCAVWVAARRRWSLRRRAMGRRRLP